MKQRIITGIILIILAVAWLVLCIPGQELSIFVYGLSLICVLAAWEYSQFVFPNVINDEHFLKSPKGYFQKNSSYALALRTLYTISVFAGISFIVNLYYRNSDLDYPLIEDIRINQIFRPSNGSNILYTLFVSSFVWWIVAACMVLFYPRSSKIVHFKSVKAITGFLSIVPFYVAMLIIRSQSVGTDFYCGARTVLSVMMLVWAADSGAYFVGKALGRHKMSPNVSPNKTFEGLGGGILFALLVFALLTYFNCYGQAYQQNLTALTVAAVATVVFSVFGDLWESLLKREGNIKDSGFIFPGHGGMLDRIDSLLAAIPVFLVVYAAVFRIME